MPLVHKTQSLCSEYFHPAATGNIPLLWPFFHLGWFSSLHCPHKFSQEGNLCRFPGTADRDRVFHNRSEALYFPADAAGGPAVHIMGQSVLQTDFPDKFPSHLHNPSIAVHLMWAQKLPLPAGFLLFSPAAGFLLHARAGCRYFRFL